MNMSPPPHTLERANQCGRSHVRHQRALRRRAHREWRRGEGAQHLSAPPRSSHGFARVPRRCTAAVQRSRSPAATLVRNATPTSTTRALQRANDPSDASWNAAAARRRPSRSLCPLPPCAAPNAAPRSPLKSPSEVHLRSAPAVARSLDRRASCELLSRCQLPVTRECAAAPAWRLHRRTDAFAFATNTAGLGTSAPAIWPRVAPADCPPPRREILFRTNVKEGLKRRKWAT